MFALEASAEDSDFGRGLAEFAVLHRRRALVLVLSDLADPLSVELQRKALAEGSRMHRILFAALDDPVLRRAAEGRTFVEAAVCAAALELQEERRAGPRRLYGTGARVIDALPAEAAAPLLSAWLEARRGIQPAILSAPRGRMGPTNPWLTRIPTTRTSLHLEATGTSPNRRAIWYRDSILSSRFAPLDT